jgi:biofilm PGA synthesis N-glycosyltransferase PgaC
MMHENKTNSESHGGDYPQYVLITAARNECIHMMATIDAVARQTVLPVKWVICVNDSTDGTLNLVRTYAESTPYIVALDVTFGGDRSFGNKSRAITKAFTHIEHMRFAFVGILDADHSFGPRYYETLIQKFIDCPRLGIATGTHVELLCGGVSRVLLQPADIAVCGMQFFHRKCFEDISGFRTLKWGGVDTLAGVMARERGWLTRTFPDIHYHHLRQMGTAGASSVLATRFSNGVRDQKLGMQTVYGFMKFIKRLGEAPACIGSFAWLAGVIFAVFLPADPHIPVACQTFLRNEQLNRMRYAVSRRICKIFSL